MRRPNAQADINAAIQTAKRDNKRVLIEFGTNWCGWCYKLFDVFHDNAEIAPIIRDEYVLVLVDVDSQKKLCDHYVKRIKEKGVPFLIVLDSDGKVLVKLETDVLEDGPRHDPKKVKAFLMKWAVPNSGHGKKAGK